MREPRNRDNGASDVWALTAYYSQGSTRIYINYKISPLTLMICAIWFYISDEDTAFDIQIKHVRFISPPPPPPKKVFFNNKNVFDVKR